MRPLGTSGDGSPKLVSRPLEWVLTGGVACGKSLVMRLLRETLRERIRCFSCDEAVHELYRDAEIAEQIVERFGDDLMLGQGGQGIDRRRLGKLVFGDAEARAELEAILHPAVLKRLEAARQAVSDESGVNLFVAEVPLYYEIGATVDADHVIVVASSPDLQVQRLMQNRGLTQGSSEAMLASQWPVVDKVAKASKVIWNDGSAEALDDQVALLLFSFDLT